jgi:hypothetical protein
VLTCLIEDAVVAAIVLYYDIFQRASFEFGPGACLVSVGNVGEMVLFVVNAPHATCTAEAHRGHKASRAE